MFESRPHVVVLGAGASRAALPDGDATGRRLPLMADLLDVVPLLRDHLVRAGVQTDPGNFEVTYSRVAEQAPAIASSIEAKIYDYFDSLTIPPTPTLYDHLLLALRQKDVIATFNWDPLLLQAAMRCGLPGVECPHLLFLHGNVLSGFCPADSVHGYKGSRCSRCRQELQPSRLLYPIATKNYDADPQIASAWHCLKLSLRQAFMVTVFGYSAPTSDASAIEALRWAWETNALREMNQLEIVDIRDEDELRDSWKDFIRFEHYEVHSSFYTSWIAKHPRRSGEAHRMQYYDAEFVLDNVIPERLGLHEMKDWFRPLVESEQGDDEG